MENLPGMLDEMEAKGTPFDVMRYIHNGVDNHPPDMRISQVVREWNEKWAYPKLVVATNAMFFKALEAQCQDVRTFRGELPHTDYVVGAISTAKETTINRLTHDKLLSAEKAATIASVTGKYSYPADKISQAYDSMLLYDEHTWGKDYPAGEIQDWAWNEKSHYAYKAAGLAQSVLTESLGQIAGSIRLEQKQRHIVVFNPLAFDRTDVVRLTRFPSDKLFDLLDDQTGRPVPYQIVELDGPLAALPYAPHRWARGQFEKHELVDLVFLAENVPSLGYKSYRLVPREAPQVFAGDLHATQNSIENRFFKVVLDPRTGAIASIHDKELARELVDQQAPDKLNQWVAKWVQTAKQEGPAAAEIHVGQKGAVCASLIAQLRAGLSADHPGSCPVRGPQADRPVQPRPEGLDAAAGDLFRVSLQGRGAEVPVRGLQLGHRAASGISSPARTRTITRCSTGPNVSNKDVGITLSPVESHLLEFGGLVALLRVPSPPRRHGARISGSPSSSPSNSQRATCTPSSSTATSARTSSRYSRRTSSFVTRSRAVPGRKPIASIATSAGPPTIRCWRCSSMAASKARCRERRASAAWTGPTFCS